jgi:CHRD domain/Calx-beta domain
LNSEGLARKELVMRAARIFSRLTLSTRLLLMVLIAFVLTALLRQNLLVRVRAAETYTVTNTNDSGHGSLRQAILDANANPGTDVINFSIGPGTLRIVLTSSLPVISDPVIIDGTTQPGFSGVPLIEVSPFQSNSLPNILNITAGGTTIRGLAINRFNECGIQISTAGDNHIEGNYIGTGQDGNQNTNSHGNGINVQAPDNFIGGTTPGSGNVISGMDGYAISITGSANKTQIQGNYIGTNATGTGALNNASGIFLGTSNNVIGGTTPAARNLIAGRDAGILMQVDGTSGNVIQGNYFGTDVTGMASLETGNYGIHIVGSSSNNTIGGTSPEARNVLSGNGWGLAIATSSGTPTNNLVQGNYIGVAADGLTPLPNRDGGILLEGAVNTTVGGDVPGAANIVAFNGSGLQVGLSQGVKVNGGNGNLIRRNSIFSNRELGLDLDNVGVTANDPGDADTGGNNRQNFPVISSVSTNASQTIIAGSLNSTANTTFTIDFYANSVCDSSGFGEGARWIGASTVSTNANGDVSFNAAFAALPPNQIVTATATDPSGNTSEFSRCTPTSPAIGSVGFTATLTVSESVGTVSVGLARVGGSAGSLTVGYSVTGLTATAGSDFVASQGLITFADGETFKTLNVSIIDDNLFELNPETVKLALSAVGDPDTLYHENLSILTINDDDPSPRLSIGDVSAAEGNSGNTFFVFPITISNPSAEAIQVTFGTSQFTAREGIDYLRANSLLVIPAGRTSSSITVSVRGDTIAEGDEIFFLNLGMSFGGSGISDGQGQGTILNDDGPPTSMTISGRVTEFGGASVPNVTINLTLNRMGVIETQTTQTNASGNYSFDDLPCADSGTVSAVLAGRKLSPGSTTFSTCGDQVANFLAVPAVVISQIYTSGGESGAVYQSDYIELLNRGGPISLNNWSVQYADANGSAWQSTTLPVLTLQPGQRLLIREGSSGGDGAVVPSPDGSGGIQMSSTAGKVALIGSSIPVQGSCPASQFLVDLIGYGTTADCFEGASAAPAPTAVAADRRSGDGCVDTDNNGADFSLGVPNPRNRFSAVNTCSSIFQFSSATYSVNEGDTFVTITVNRTGDTSGAATVDFASSNGTATQTRDYQVASGTLSFAAGESSKTFRVLIVDDAFAESSETVNLSLSNPSNGVFVTPMTATLTIADNDSAGTISPIARQFVSNLVGAEEVPPTGNTVKGNGGIFQLSNDELSAKVSLLFSGLTGSETGAHVHSGAPGVNGPIIFPLPLGNPINNFVVSPTAQQVIDLRVGQQYMNVHSTGFVNGEIRGQLLWNPAEEANFFVRQAYFDFLNRVPDAGGFVFWQNEITQCQSDVACLRRKRVDVSNAFFYEQEFQQTAAYVLRLYRAAYGNNQPFPNPNPNPGFPNEEKKLPSYAAFVSDRARVIGGANLTQKQLDLATLFVSRLEFVTKYPATLATADQFVDAVLATLQTDLGVNLTSQRANLIALYNQGGRAAVMYRLADDNASNPIANQALIDAEYNRTFVLGQYFGYLRRNPDIAGFVFWLGQVNGAPLRDVPRQHAMVCSFVTSAEYQFRFGPVASRNNNECPQ